jgi:predicted CXXCH cytochrome family protein
MCHRAGTYGLPDPANLGTLSATYDCIQGTTPDTDTVCDTLAGWPAVRPVAPTSDTWAVSTFTIVPPQTAACTSCHDSPASKAHAELNTSAAGVETCEVCHGDGAAWDALEVHVPAR